VVAGKYQYHGRLSETTLPEILFTIDRFRVPGLIEARHGEIVKRIYIRDGYVVHAGSNDSRDRLGDYLQRQGKLGEDEYQEVSRELEGSNQRFGVLLIEKELLSPADVYRAIREHIEEIVWSLFYWHQGDVTFAIGEHSDAEMVQIHIPMRRVILQGIQRAPDAKRLVSRLGRRGTILEPCFRQEELIETALGAEEYQMLTLVNGRKSLYELCSEGPLAPAENAKLLYAFQVLHLVRRRAARATTSGPLKIRLDTSADSYPG